jgi:UDP-sugar pyrophosphorylase
MTSRDTHQGTLATLKANANFGLAEDQITILRQELVPALSDLNASLALDEKYQLALKPHGHGDIHMLLHSSGTAKRLANAGIRYLLFIQDTNGQVFNAALAAIGVSEERGYDFNSIAVNRVPGEAVGAIARLVKPGRPDLTLNVEYNQLDPLLRATISPAGDVPDSRGYSLFPGNINLLVIRLAPYIKVLEASGGVVAEFVNPKFADATRTTFKKPARLETLMQDLPKSFTSGEKTGVTIFDRIWCFSPCKNTLADAASKAAADSPAESASSAENDFYLAGRQKLRMAGMTVTDGPIRSIRGIPFTTGPRVILRPSFALTLQDVRDHIAGGSIAGDASLVLDGPIRLENVVIESGATLHATAAPGATATLSDTTIHRDTTYTLHELTDAEMSSADTPEFLKIRGFRIENPGVKKHQLPVTSSSTKQASA